MNWLFEDLLKIALGNKKLLSRTPSEADWNEAYLMAEKQTTVGLLLSAVEALNEKDKTIMPPPSLFYQWVGEVIRVETNNKVLDNAAGLLTSIFLDGGIRCCVLKGQGLAQLYPQPERRQSGDIDIWAEGGRKNVLSFLKRNCFGIGNVVIHHVDSEIIEGVETEIHFMPVYACNPFLHIRLQKFFNSQSDIQFEHFKKQLGFAYPTLRFNAIYVLSHIYMHFLYEGIGLRQIIDYYYVLEKLNDEEREQAKGDVCNVGLSKFAGAVMFVLVSLCGIDESKTIAKLDKKRGTLLNNEIFKSGNFGKYDERLKNRDEKNLISFNIVAIKRQLRFLYYYPLDVISIPFFKVWHWCWRKVHGYL